MTNVFPYGQAITSGALASDPCRYSAHGLWNNGSTFIYFFHLRGTIHRPDHSPVISPHRQWLPDTRAPCKGCRHSSISARCEHTDKSVCGDKHTVATKHTTAWILAHKHAHKSNLCLNQIPSFWFADVKQGEGVACAGKVITISHHFGVVPQSSPTPNHSEA